MGAVSREVVPARKTATRNLRQGERQVPTRRLGRDLVRLAAREGLVVRGAHQLQDLVHTVGVV